MKPNSLLVCTKEVNWKIGYGPKKDEIVTLDCIMPDDENYIILIEYTAHPPIRATYLKEYFREIQPPMEITIEEILTEKV